MPRNFCWAFYFAFLCSSVSFAVLPPLSQEQRESYAEQIIEGQVTFVEKPHTEYTRPGFSNNIYRAQLEVTKVIKGNVNTGSTINIYYWVSKDRPSGWAGPTGQYQASLIGAGKNIRVYTYFSDDYYRLLEPNGFDIISQ